MLQHKFQKASRCAPIVDASTFPPEVGPNPRENYCILNRTDCTGFGEVSCIMLIYKDIISGMEVDIH
jgi:hypothetical protein